MELIRIMMAIMHNQIPVTITVTFTEAVTVTGSPRLLLDTTPASYVYYFDGSGTNALTFKDLVNEEAEAAL
jgi:hypothetical protein